MIGVDISNHQKGIDLLPAKQYIDFAIIKATEGLSFIDPSFNNHVRMCQNLGLKLGAYHYARPDNRPSKDGMREEAKWFCDTVYKAGILGKAILVLDWEQNCLSRDDLAGAFLNEVLQLTGITPFIYASTWILKLENFADITKNYFTWEARWPTTEQVGVSAAAQFVTRYTTPVSTIWQFTSNGTIPGYSGRVDFDYTQMTKQEWDHFSTGNAPEEELNDDMKWAIENGIYKGFSDGTYRPDAQVTRSQLATVLRRFANSL